MIGAGIAIGAWGAFLVVLVYLLACLRGPEPPVDAPIIVTVPAPVEVVDLYDLFAAQLEELRGLPESYPSEMA